MTDERAAAPAGGHQRERHGPSGYRSVGGEELAGRPHAAGNVETDAGDADQVDDDDEDIEEIPKDLVPKVRAAIRDELS